MPWNLVGVFAGAVAILVCIVLTVTFMSNRRTERLIAETDAMMAAELEANSPTATPEPTARPTSSPRSQTVGDLYLISSAIALYSMENNIYPPATSIRTLDRELTPKFADSIPITDGWSRMFEVNSSRTSFEIRSLGEDGTRSGDDIVMTEDGIEDGK